MPIVTVMSFVAPRYSQNAIANNDRQVVTVGASLRVLPKQFYVASYSRIGKALPVKDGRVHGPISSFSRSTALAKLRNTRNSFGSGFCGRTFAKIPLRFSASLVPKSASASVGIIKFGTSGVLPMKFNIHNKRVGVAGMLSVACDIRVKANFGRLTPLPQVFLSTLNVVDGNPIGVITSSKTAVV